MSEAKSRIIVALDVDSLDKVTTLVETLSPYVGYFKVGLELMTALGAPQIVQHIHSLGGQIFFDGKFCDIPNTVAGASKAVAGLGVKMFDLHASCGVEAIKAAVKNKGNSEVLAVTVLTSLEEITTRQIFGASQADKVIQFAREAEAAGVDGIVCSPEELPLVGAQPELKRLKRVTPGIRPAWAAANDQKRFLSPAEAVRKGATHMVIGRPITSPPPSIGSPVSAVKKILEEIEGVH